MRHMIHPQQLAVATALVVGAACAGCSPADREPGSTAPSSTQVTATQSVTQGSAAGVPSSTATPAGEVNAASTEDEVKAALAFSPARTQQAPAPGTELSVSDVRAGSHEGFDRVVFEFTGAGTPGYTVAYTPEPRQQASGYPLEVAGGAYLEIMVHGTPMAMVSPRDDLVKAGPMNVSAGGVEGVTHGGVFEAESQYVIGLDHQRPYRAYTLENPARLVIDIER